MGVERLRSYLRLHRTVGLDTNIFIYHLESNSKYVTLTDLIFRWMQGPGNLAVTSTITLTELLVAPYRRADKEQVDLIYGQLVSFPNLKWHAPNLKVADTAAELRARYGLKTPDALQVATAMAAGATGLITNDRQLERVQEVDVFVLASLL